MGFNSAFKGLKTQFVAHSNYPLFPLQKSEVLAVSCDIHTKRTNTLCGQNADVR